MLWWLLHTPNNNCCIQAPGSNKGRIRWPGKAVYTSTVETPLFSTTCKLVSWGRVENDFAIRIWGNQVVSIWWVTNVRHTTSVIQTLLQCEACPCQAVNVNLEIKKNNNVDSMRFNV